LAGWQPTRQVTAEQARESALRTLEERRERLDAALAQQSASLLPPATCLRCLHDAPPPAPTTSAVDLPPPAAYIVGARSAIILADPHGGPAGVLTGANSGRRWQGAPWAHW
jgi:hypothetical protein